MCELYIPKKIITFSRLPEIYVERKRKRDIFSCLLVDEQSQCKENQRGNEREREKEMCQNLSKERK